MIQLRTCARGHFWEAEEGPGSLYCPACGAVAESLPLLDLVQMPSAAAPLVEVEPPLVDEHEWPVLVGYRLREDLGRSPTGARLFLAEQAAARRDVLLTLVVAREDSTQHAWGSLRGEAAALARVNHPCFPVLYDTGQRDRQLFFNATSETGGVPLPTFLAGLERPLAPGQVARLMEVLTAAMAAAHEEDQVHRHLHPHAIFLCPAPGGQAAVETGLVCRLGDGYFVPQVRGLGRARRTNELGPYDVELYGDQPGYLSPEQAWGRGAELGQATDVYGLGGIFYFLLTGRPPFPGADLAETLDAIQSAPLPAPRSLRRVPEDLDLICRKCLHRVPSSRYASPAELADDLRRARQRLPLRAGPNTGLVRMTKWARRGPLRAALLATLALAVVIGLLLVSKDSGASLRRARTERDSARRLADSLGGQFAELREVDQFGQYREAIARAARALEQNDRATALDALREWEGAGPCGLEWALLQQQARRVPAPTTGRLASSVRAAAICPSTGQVALVTGDGADKRRVSLWAPNGRVEPLSLEQVTGTVVGVDLLGKERELAVLSRHAAQKGSELHVFALGQRPPLELAWQRRWPSEQLVSVAAFPTVDDLFLPRSTGELVRVAGHKETPRVEGPPLPVPSDQVRVAFRPGGQRVAVYASGVRDLHLLDVRNGRLVATLTSDQPVRALAFGPDGALAVARLNRTLTIHSPDSSEPLYPLAELPAAPQALAFSEDGRRLAAACESGRLVVYGHCRGRWALLLQTTADGSVALAFTANDRGLIAVGPNGATAWGERPALRPSRGEP